MTRALFVAVLVLSGFCYGADRATVTYLSEDKVTLDRLEEALPMTKGGVAVGRAPPPLPKVAILLTFSPNSTALSEKGMKVIGVLKEAMDDIWLQYDFVIEGHSDPRGKARANQKLSRNRAARVRELLIKSGISEDRLRAVGKGEQEPVNIKDPRDPRNRRVVFQPTFPKQ